MNYSIILKIEANPNNITVGDLIRFASDIIKKYPDINLIADAKVIFTNESEVLNNIKDIERWNQNILPVIEQNDIKEIINEKDQDYHFDLSDIDFGSNKQERGE